MSCSLCSPKRVPTISDLEPRTGLDDLCVRFIVNLPESELSGFDRIGTHVEEAHWFYEDFIRPLDPSLPQMSLRTFSLRLFQHCPLTAHCDPNVLEQAYAHWIGYKKRIPVRGAILLNEAMDSVLLVRGWHKSSAWMFPRGKINQGEDDLDCAVREVYEETGFNAMEAGLIPEDRALRHFEMSIKDQHVKLFVIPNVPMDTHFEPRTRKEIGKIQWYKLAELPGRKKKQGQDSVTSPSANKFFMIASFLEPLNRWIKQQLKKKDRMRNIHRSGHLSQAEVDDVMTEEEGMTTEAAPEPRPVFATAESHEAATKELHRLLKIQPPTQRSQAGTYSAEQDKGKALLAMLQQKNDAPSQEPGNHLPHTPFDHVQNVAPQPHTPHYHHPTQRVVPENLQAPPPFPVQPDINNQLLSMLGVSVNPTQHTMQQNFQASQQQLAMMMASAPAKPPALAHPQPLPRQANHLLAGPTASAASVPGNQAAQAQQQTNVPGALPASMNLPQQLMANFRQPPAVLDNTRLALLNAFKKDANPPESSMPNDSSHQPQAAGELPSSQRQPLDSGLLGSPYGGQRSSIPARNQFQNTTVPPHGSPSLHISQAALKPSSVSPMQQKALLDIFKKEPSVSTPQREYVGTDLKENGSPYLSAQRGFQQPVSPGFHAGSATPPTAHQTNNSSIQATGIPNLPYGARSIAMRPKTGDQIAVQQSLPGQSGSQLLSAFAPDGVGLANRAHIMGSPGRPSQSPHLSGSTYSHTTQAGMLTPPANLNSFPNLAPRRQENDPQQVQKLMSLFNKTATTVPASTLATPNTALKGKEPALYNAGQMPTPGSRVGLMGASPGLDGTGGAVTMSRRSSQQQAPISPENEKFLLNYLKTVSGSSK